MSISESLELFSAHRTDMLVTDTKFSFSPPAAYVADAPVPFNSSGADTIVRSIDGVDFRVRRAILAESSSFFEHMFHLPQPPAAERIEEGGYKDGLPLVPVDEPARVLGPLLRICYPGRNPKLGSFDAVRMLLRAAKRYDMDVVVKVIEDHLRALLQDETPPMRVYAIAVRHGLKDAAVEAARWSLNQEKSSLYTLELEEISGGEYHRIMQYRERCSAVAFGIATDFSWLEPGDWIWFQCRTYECRAAHRPYLRGDAVFTPRAWWSSFMERSAELLKERSCGQAISEEGWLDIAFSEAVKCSTCQTHVFPQMREFMEMFVAQVEMAVSEVLLEIK